MLFGGLEFGKVIDLCHSGWLSLDDAGLLEFVIVDRVYFRDKFVFVALCEGGEFSESVVNSFRDGLVL